MIVADPAFVAVTAGVLADVLAGLITPDPAPAMLGTGLFSDWKI